MTFDASKAPARNASTADMPPHLLNFMLKSGNPNEGAIREGNLLLLDAGVEGNSLYTADIIRTLTICGKFTRDQRAVYESVLEAQCAE